MPMQFKNLLCFAVGIQITQQLMMTAMDPPSSQFIAKGTQQSISSKIIIAYEYALSIFICCAKDSQLHPTIVNKQQHAGAKIRGKKPGYKPTPEMLETIRSDKVEGGTKRSRNKNKER